MRLTMDDLMSPDFSDLSHIRCHTGEYSVSCEIYRSSRSCMLIPTCRMHTETRTCSLFYHSPSVKPLLSHLVRPVFFGIWLSSCFLSWETFPSCLDLIWITEITCSMIDDSMSPGFWPTVHSMSCWGIFSFWLRFIDLHGAIWSLPLAGCTPRRGRVLYSIMVPRWSLS